MSDTRLEKIIESTAEAETELVPETRLEKVILDTGRKIQEEIGGGGGKLYKHYIALLDRRHTSINDAYITIYTTDENPFTKESLVEKMSYEIINATNVFTDSSGISTTVAINITELTPFGDIDYSFLRIYINNNGTVTSGWQMADNQYQLLSDIVTEM